MKLIYKLVKVHEVLIDLNLLASRKFTVQGIPVVLGRVKSKLFFSRAI